MQFAARIAIQTSIIIFKYRVCFMLLQSLTKIQMNIF